MLQAQLLEGKAVREHRGIYAVKCEAGPGIESH